MSAQWDKGRHEVAFSSRSYACARQFSARALQANSMWPAPVIDATMASGERVRMSFHSPASGLDIARARRLVETVTRSTIVDATYWRQGEQIDVLDTAKARRAPKSAGLIAKIAAILDNAALEPVAALREVRSLIAA